MMRHAVFAVLAAVTPFPQTSRAQLSAERVVRFVVPEANALANSISLYGDTALLGTIDPEAYAFQLDRGDWWMHRLVLPSPDGFFMVVSLYEDVALIGVRPHAYIFRFDGSAWVHEGTLTDDRGDGDFGHTVDVDGSLAVVGTRSMDVQVFRFNGREWVLEARLAPPPPRTAALLTASPTTSRSTASASSSPKARR